jgi:hypothetical protein
MDRTNPKLGFVGNRKKYRGCMTYRYGIVGGGYSPAFRDILISFQHCFRGAENRNVFPEAEKCQK